MNNLLLLKDRSSNSKITIKTGHCAGAACFTCTVSVRIAEGSQDCRYLSTGRHVKSPSLPLGQHVTHTSDQHRTPGDRVHWGSQAWVETGEQKQEEPSKCLINKKIYKYK